MIHLRINIVKSKNAEQIYVIKSFRKDGKSTSKIMKKLGTMASLLPQHNNDREQVISWAKEQARLMTEADKDMSLSLSVEFSSSKQITMNEKLLFNAGYLFLQKIFYELGLDHICSSISAERDFDFNLTDILAKMIYSRVIHPSSNRSSYSHSLSDVEPPKHDLHHVYRALDVLAENSDLIQSRIYANSKKLKRRNTSILYYDCTNYYCEIEATDEDYVDEVTGEIIKDFRKHGLSKEHRPNPIVQMGLFLDSDGIPLAFNIFPGNKNEQPTLLPLEKQIIQDFGLSHFIVCTDAGLASTENRRFNTLSNRSYVVTQSLKQLKKYLKEWALDSKDWHIPGDAKAYDISQIDEDKYYGTVFFKERWIKENGIEQRLIVTYSPKYKAYERSIRERQIERAQKIVDKGASAKTRNLNSPARFVKEQSVTEYGEVAEKVFRMLDDERIKDEENYDGFSAVCTTLEDPAGTIIGINKRRWEIEAAFRVMKSEFKARPVYVRKDERIKAHFLTCFLALLVLRILESRLGNEYTTEEIISTLRAHKLRKIDGVGYIPAFERTPLTDKLHEISGFRTDNEIITEKNMKKILKALKN